MIIDVQRSISIFMAVFGIGLVSQAGAKTPDSVSKNETEGALAAELSFSEMKRGISVGYQYGFVEYNEPGLMKEYGSLHGINASYDWTLDDVKYIRFETDLMAGGLTYDGATWAGTPVTSDTKDSIFNLRGLWNWNHHFITAAIGLNWYGGLGFRYLNDKILSQGGYEREISYVYLPVGVGLTQQLNSGWSIGGALEYDIFLTGRVKSHLSNVNPDQADLENIQSSGFGARLNMNIRKDFKTYAIKVQPSCQYWRIKDSNVVALKDQQGRALVDPGTGRALMGLEPENEFKMFGLNLIAEI